MSDVAPTIETALLERARSGDQQAVLELYTSAKQAVYKFILYRVGTKTDAEDLFQDVMLVACSRLETFRGETSFRNWCYEIARRKIAAFWKQQYSTDTLDLDAVIGVAEVPQLAEDEAERVVHDARSTAELATVLQQLPDNYRTILELRFLKGASVAEAATAMNVTVANAKVLQHRALKKAATILV